MTIRAASEAKIGGADSFEFALVSRSFTRKAQSLRRQGKATIAFHDPRASGENGYVALSGTVHECSTPAEKERVWKGSWSLFHPQQFSSNEVLVWRFSPTTLEMVAHSNLCTDDWAAITMRQTKTGENAGWTLQPRRRDAKKV